MISLLKIKVLSYSLILCEFEGSREDERTGEREQGISRKKGRAREKEKQTRIEDEGTDGEGRQARRGGDINLDENKQSLVPITLRISLPLPSPPPILIILLLLITLSSFFTRLIIIVYQ